MCGSPIVRYRNCSYALKKWCSREGSECDWRVDALDDDEMVRALNGRDGVTEEEVRLRTC